MHSMIRQERLQRLRFIGMSFTSSLLVLQCIFSSPSSAVEGHRRWILNLRGSVWGQFVTLHFVQIDARW